MNVLDFAKQRLQEEQDAHEQGADNTSILNYWAAYIDGATAQKKESKAQNSDILTRVAEQTAAVCVCVAEYAKQMNELVEEGHEAQGS